MKRFIIYWFLTLTHKQGLCEPFHYIKNTREHKKGYCPVLQQAWDTLFNYQEKVDIHLDNERFKSLLKTNI